MEVDAKSHSAIPTLPCLQPCPRHALPQPALRQKRILQLADLPIQQVIRLVKETDQDVRHDLRRTGLDVRPISII